MGGTIIQYEDRSEPLFDRLMARNRDYCARHGYRYLRPTEPIRDIPPYWVKVVLVRDVVAESADGDIVGWLDSDACIHDVARPMSSLFNNVDVDVLISKDAWDHTEPTLNVGVFFIRVTPHSRVLVNRWWAVYETRAHEHWHRDEQTGKWTCDGEWAGPEYEQGAFNVLVANDVAVGRYPTAMFDNSAAFPSTDTTFSCHLIGPGTDKRQNIRAYLTAQSIPMTIVWLCVLAGAVAWL